MSATNPSIIAASHIAFAVLQACLIPDPSFAGASVGRQGGVINPRRRSEYLEKDTKKIEISATREPDWVNILAPDTSRNDKILSSLESFKSWPANWNGEDAPAPSERTICAATQLYSLVASGDHVFSVGLDGNSQPVFYLRESPYEGHLMLEDASSVSFFFSKGASILDGYDLPFDGRILPDELLRTLEQL